MKRNLFLSISSIFFLASCGTTNSIPKVNNTISGYDTGIPSVELTTVYGNNEITSIMDSASSSLDKTTFAKISRYSYQLDGNITYETSVTEDTSISFYGADRQYALAEDKIESTTKMGKAVTSKSVESSQIEYAVGDRGKIAYTKNEHRSASGKQTTNFYSDYKEAGGTNLRRNLLSSYFSTAPYYSSTGSGLIGSTKDGRLYYVFYGESSNKNTAYNDNGETIVGFVRTYKHALFDLNTVSEPRCNAMYQTTISETNIGKDGIRTDDYHISEKNSIECTLQYGVISDNETKRASFIQAYPETTLSNYYVRLLSKSSSGNYINLRQDPVDETKYTGTYEPYSYNLGEKITFVYDATKKQIDKQNETVSTIAITDKALYVNPWIIVRGEYPEDAVVASDNAITFNRSIPAKITFQASNAEPYLKIMSIELL